METIADYRFLCDHLSRLPRPAIVGVEGFTLSGKSYLADALQKDIGAHVVHIDQYVTGKNALLPYADRLDYRRICSAIEHATAESSLLIIDGICLREVRRRLDLAPGLFVYVKRLTRNGLWHDGFHLEDFESAPETVENLKEPHRSDLSYHSAEHPHEHADLVFHRVDVDH
jgi:uridine kinase